MGKRIRILRQKLNTASSYSQVFEWNEGTDNLTIAEVLNELNAWDPLETVDGQPAEPIRFAQSCRQKKCGACAMLIQGVPRLACSVRLSDFPEEVIDLAPLRKFPVVVDLVVDRSVIQENLKALKVWPKVDMELFDGELEDTYDSARCLQCGCCLEVCPNFMAGDNFFGAAGTLAATRLILSLSAAQEKDLYKGYSRHIYNGCGKSLSCQAVCPAEISIEHLLSRSNAKVIWHRG